jgi:hypothetical protein
LYNKLYPEDSNKPTQVELFDGDSKVFGDGRLTRKGNQIMLESAGQKLVIIVGMRDKIVGFKQ